MEPGSSAESTSQPTCCDTEREGEKASISKNGSEGGSTVEPSASCLKPAPLPQKKSAWFFESPSAISGTGGGIGAATKGPKTLSFADIVAEQSCDRKAALAAYEGPNGAGTTSLAEIEAEQERLFSTLEQQKQQPSRSLEPPPAAAAVAPAAAAAASYDSWMPSSHSQNTALHDDDLDAEELRLIQLAMQLSLDDVNLSNHSNSSIDSNCNSKNSDDDTKVAAIEYDRKQPGATVDERLPDYADSNLPVPADLIDKSSESNIPDGATGRRKRCNSSSGSAHGLPKALKDTKFSERTLREIERTEVVVDSPHTDALRMEHRQRLSSSSSHSRLSASPRTARRSLSMHLQNKPTRRSESSVGSASSSSSARSATAAASRAPPSLDDDDAPAEENPSKVESLQIEQARRESESNDIQHENLDGVTSGDGGKMPEGPSQQIVPSCNEMSASETEPPAPEAAPVTSLLGLSDEEAAAIEAALREADAMEEAESLQLALQIQQEELRLAQERWEQHRRHQQTSGNVRIMTRAEFQAESGRALARSASNGFSATSTARTWIGAVPTTGQPRRHPLDDSVNDVDNGNHGQVDDDGEHERLGQYLAGEQEAGFRMNSASHQQQWNRLDRNTIVGPNSEVRTKHDVRVQGQTNAQFLDLETDDRGVRAHVGNEALNSFRKSMKRSTKGVASHGTGRAGSDTDATRGKALDPHVRLQISRAINNGLIDRCNGAVKQGKEAIVYHANGGGSGSHGFDVAVKVFKRIQEFRGRGEYVDGDPRYAGRAFRSLTDREQLELWTEKEYRNLVRAHRAKVPVPTPLYVKDNIIFMRFMGNSGWPSPQIREIEMRKQSKKWDVLYTQVMESIRRLYVDARLVHGDLSEYNILISPAFQLDHPISSVEDASNDLQTVFIDFGQAVDVRHPLARELLERDLSRVKGFFMKQGVKTLSVDDAMEFVVDDFENGREEDSLPSISSSQRSIVNAGDAVVRPA